MKFWRYIITVLCAISCATLCTILVGCATDTYEITDKGFTWRYKGLIDDTTMVVEVEHWEQGTIHCNHFMSYEDGESFTNTLSTYYYSADLRSSKVGKKKSTPTTTPRTYVPQKSARKNPRPKPFCRRRPILKNSPAGQKAASPWILSTGISIA